MGVLYVNGFGVDPNYKKAEEYFAKACNLSDEMACKYKKRIQEEIEKGKK